METLNFRIFFSFYLALWGVLGGIYFFTFSSPKDANELKSPSKITGITAIQVVGQLRLDPFLGPIYAASKIIDSESRKDWIIHYDTNLGRITYLCKKLNPIDKNIVCERI